MFGRSLAIGVALDPRIGLRIWISGAAPERDIAGAVDRLDEGRGAAMHDRHFRPVDLDEGGCSTPETGQRGEHVLGGRAQRPGRHPPSTSGNRSR